MKNLILTLALLVSFSSFGQDGDINYNSEKSIINYLEQNPSTDILEGVWWTTGGQVLIRKNLDNYVAIFSSGGYFYGNNPAFNTFSHKDNEVIGDTVAILEPSAQGNKLFVKEYSYYLCNEKWSQKKCDASLARKTQYLNIKNLKKISIVPRKNKKAILKSDKKIKYDVYRAISGEYTIDLSFINAPVKISEGELDTYTVLNYSPTNKSKISAYSSLFSESEYIIMKIKNPGTSIGAPFFKIFPKPNLSNQTAVRTSTTEWAGNGSGIFISESGYIVTNYHVIEDSKEIEVEFILNEEVQKFKAQVVQIDKINDLAILKIEDTKFKGIYNLPYNFKTRSSDVGTKVYAYGYPMALSVMGKEIKITDGIISSKSGYDGDITTYQISAPIQGGNSGGPLFDDKGNFLGINSSGLGADVANNVGYTIKSSYVLNLIDVLPKTIDLPSSTKLQSLPLTEQIKEISKYVVLIKVK